MTTSDAIKNLYLMSALTSRADKVKDFNEAVSLAVDALIEKEAQDDNEADN